VTPAAEPAPVARPVQLYQRGVDAFRAKRFDEAAALFQEAYALDPSPVLLYNLGRAQEVAGLADAAIATFRQYLARYPTAEDRGRVEEKIRILEQVQRHARMGRIAVQGVPEGSVWRVGEVLLAPESGAIKVEPGRVTLSISAPDRPVWRYAIEIAAGEHLEVAYGAEPPVADSGWRPRTVAGLATLGGALVFAGVGTGLLVASQDDDGAAARQFDAKRAAALAGDVARAEALDAEITRLNDDASLEYTLSLASFGAAAIAAGVGTWLLLSGEPPGETSGVRLLASPAGLVLGGTF
jgi:tetratricopeptide (TPR) repeat protein